MSDRRNTVPINGAPAGAGPIIGQQPRPIEFRARFTLAAPVNGANAGEAKIIALNMQHAMAQFLASALTLPTLTSITIEYVGAASAIITPS